MSMKVVLKAQLDCEKCKRRAMKIVAGVEGVDSVQIDPKDNKITVIGDTDPVSITTKLRKFGWTELLSVGPAKEPPKPAQTGQKKDDKKDGGQKDEKKDDKKDGDAKKDGKKEASNPAPNINYVYLPKPEPYGGGYTYYLSDENPNACTIS